MYSVIGVIKRVLELESSSDLIFRNKEIHSKKKMKAPPPN